jgi:hypothetical protein
MADRLDPTFVRAQIANLRAAYPQMDEDEQLRLDMIEGSTDVHEFLTGVVIRIADANAKIEALGDLIAAFKARCDRFEQRSDAMRSLAHKVMDWANVRKVELPAATLSIRAGQPRVIITDETRLPEQFVRIKREPDKHLIASHLKAGERVEGAALSNSEPVLSVRVK